jgi:hypothetical protein
MLCMGKSYKLLPQLSQKSASEQIQCAPVLKLGMRSGNVAILFQRVVGAGGCLGFQFR